MRAPPGARVARLQSSAARAPRVAHHRSPRAGTARRAHRGRPARAGERSSTLAAGLPADRLGPLAGFETLDDRIEPLGLDLLAEVRAVTVDVADAVDHDIPRLPSLDRKSTRLNSSHRCISYAVFCLKKKSDELETSRAPPL